MVEDTKTPVLSLFFLATVYFLVSFPTVPLAPQDWNTKCSELFPTFLPTPVCQMEIFPSAERELYGGFSHLDLQKLNT